MLVDLIVEVISFVVCTLSVKAYKLVGFILNANVEISS